MAGDETDDKLPDGVPAPPELAKVQDLRARLLKDQRESGRGAVRPLRRVDEKQSRQARDIGIYTIIPMMMIAGPAIGYLLGLFLQNAFGGEPWFVVGGALFGLVAAFRQIFLLLSRRADEDKKRRER